MGGWKGEAAAAAMEVAARGEGVEHGGWFSVGKVKWVFGGLRGGKVRGWLG